MIRLRRGTLPALGRVHLLFAKSVPPGTVFKKETARNRGVLGYRVGPGKSLNKDAGAKFLATWSKYRVSCERSRLPLSRNKTEV